MAYQIRNFVIIAHIDHGKSTLADRFLELTGTVEKRKMREQVLDSMDLERERGITIKMQPVRMVWRQNHAEILNPKSEILNKSQISNFNAPNSLEFRNSNLEFADSEYILNLIDTPGHVDFSYEVSRALAAVEGAILLVDATQGVQAQTVANLNLALKEKIIIIPAVNKIDLPLAEVEKTEEEIAALLSVDPRGILKVSGKTGAGVEDLLRAVIEKVPPPEVSGLPNNRPLRALVFDSLFDPYQGIIAYVRIMEGEVRKGERVRFMTSKESAELLEVGVFSPGRTSKETLEAGEIGYLATGIKEPELIRVGDTVFKIQNSNFQAAVEPLPGYREPEPMVFASIFPENQDEHDLLRESLKKLKLNDAALVFEPEESSALGRGFRAGFLGMLHMEIVSERLRREYGLILTFTNPSVAFLVHPVRSQPRRGVGAAVPPSAERTSNGVKAAGEKRVVYAATKMPEPHELESIEEPWAGVEIITPPRYFGALTALINDRRGTIVDTKTLAGDRLLVRFEAPLREIIIDFYDKLKSISQGFASLSYEVLGFREADLVRLDILVAGEKVAPLAEMVPREQAYFIGRQKVEKLKELLARELFAVAIQAEVEGKIIARETLSALKKDVTGYLYGGDRTRKMKLWKKQKRGKKKLKEMGKVKIPPEVYLRMLKPH